MSSHSPNTSYSAETPSNSFLKIRPKELVFHPPFSGVIGNELKLINTSDHILAYKVKTTAPARYCVRPNTGIIPPGKTIEVRIFLNCTKEKDLPPLSMKTKDKFQILYIVVEDPSIDPKSIWQNVAPESIMKHKLKTVFTLPPTNVEQTNHSSPSPSSSKPYLQQQQQQQDSSSAYKSNNTLFAEVQNMESESDKSNFSSTFSTKSGQTTSTISTTDSDKTNTLAPNPTIKKRIINTTSSSSSSNNTETDDPIKLRNIIKDLNDKIEKLESLSKAESSSTSTATQRKPSIDSIQTLIVILIIAVISFIFGRLL
ncbi:hypothetical protein CYY_001551 [Polysphondylium violaceum]|uniref:MSP domain-containing protein n=1 Tax=Polysphondylium violaceum TaxID=133409 RepID=A0A8J4PZZ6_9MYCE|nr:hypothetical protein CYY_001551 [Polysphondylium violaceum]